MSIVGVDKTKLPDQIFKGIFKIAAAGVVVLFAALFITLVFESLPSIKAFGFSFLTGKEWDPVTGEFGALPFFIGTLITSFLALFMALPFTFSIGILLGEYRKSGKFAAFLKSMVELLAGIPSIIYGFWGIFFLVPVIRNLEIKLGVMPYGVGILTASLILTVMIIPYAASMAREVISMVPSDLKEAAFSLGATRAEVIVKIIIPYSWSGIMAGIMLAFGRALGETMAITMLIGNSNFLPDSIFSPANTMASVIANEFAEATGDLYLSALVEIGLLLFVLTAIINMIGKKIVDRYSIQK